MSDLLDLHLDQVEDPEVVDAGEYQLRVVSAKIEKSKSSERNVVKVMLEIIDHPTAQPVFDNLAFPLKDDEEKTKYMMKLNMKKFFTAIGIDLADPGNPEGWKGLEAWAILKQEMNEQRGELQNTISSWIVSK